MSRNQLKGKFNTTSDDKHSSYIPLKIPHLEVI